jgi:hypothetical protein
MDAKWRQESAFPVIASAIESLCRGPEHFVTRKEIVHLLLQEQPTRKLIVAAYKETKQDRSIPVAPTALVVFPDEVEETPEELLEGAVYQSFVNAHERNPLARQKCIEKYGSQCYVCGFSFGATYGKVADGLMHVHHLVRLSEIRGKYKVDPIAHLRPVRPNCHAVIHHRRSLPLYSIEEVRSFLRR